ncbi:MAG TPA: 3-deoxy-7-phosphoheptulonate synthase [Thermomicrobiales bacterium]|nr:3-deoxy-7-phosphoheptulonate synthase [Thermomicrobiales bacterium]HRA48926.1 3-deoxy-7-phosphoheptulonate synthase [Thermomicrobiales bacterium]
MIITLDQTVPDATRTAIADAAALLGSGYRELVWDDGARVVAIDGDLAVTIADLPGVTGLFDKHKAYMLASTIARARSTVQVGNAVIGSAQPTIMAGPCVVEDRETLIATAFAAQAAGATILRGGAFKPRTSPYAFQGHGELGLQHLAAARDATGMPVVTEVMEPDQVDLVATYADMLQIGSRNMQNYPLLRAVGKRNVPVLLKRGYAATVEEWLMAAEYILAQGNPNVVLCERGIRAFDPAFRFTLDLNAVPMARELTHLPIIVDPSHGTGKRSLVGPMALAGIAAGADGLIIEIHPDPDTALCDAAQTITPAQLAVITAQANAIAQIRQPETALLPVG